MNEKNLTDRKFYVLKDSGKQTDIYITDIPVNLIKKYELLDAFSRAGNWPAKMVFAISDYRKKGLTLTDYVYSSFSLFFVSNKFKELLNHWNLGNKEYLPIQIANHKAKNVIADNYWIINFIEFYEAVDKKKSIFEVDAGNPSRIFSFDKLVFKEEMIPLLPSCFRLKEQPQLIIIDQNLLDAIREAGLTGMKFKSVQEFKTYDVEDDEEEDVNDDEDDSSTEEIHQAELNTNNSIPSLLLNKLKKEKAKQIIISIEEFADEVSVSFEKPDYEFEYTSEYLYHLKKATYSSLKKIINQNPDEPFKGFFMDSFSADDLENSIDQSKVLMQQLGFAHFKPLATLKFEENNPAYVEKFTQHLYWAGNDKHLGEIEQESDIANEDGSINWESEVDRMKEECKAVILDYFEDHPDEKFESLTISAVEHVGILINGSGPEECDYFPTNIYSPDIEIFLQENETKGEAEYLKHLEKATELLRSDKELTHLFTESTEIDIIT